MIPHVFSTNESHGDFFGREEIADLNPKIQGK